MFDWLINGVQDFRIDFAFPAYEEKEKVAHARLAERKFCTEKIIKQIDRLMEKPNQKAIAFYQTPIVIVSDKIRIVSNELTIYRSHYFVFNRNYKSELALLYEAKNKLNTQLNESYSDKNDAVHDLDNAKEDIADWYSSAKPTFFGSNKKIPQYSLFGQSVNDLERYKDARDEAYSDIQHCSQEIAIIKAKRDKLFLKIKNVKGARQRMYDLIKKGLNVHKIKTVISENEKELAQLNNEKKQLEIDLGKFLEQAKLVQGVDHLEAEIKRMNELKQDFLVSFDSPRAKEARKIAHRVEWLREHL